MKELSTKFSAIAPSLTLEITAKANELKAKGESIVSFSAGEPDFNTPENIRNVAVERIGKGGNGYTAASGLPLLKQAVSAKLLRDNGLSYDISQIVISNGAKHSISNALLAVTNPGDEILVPAPYWVSYVELVKMAGGSPVIVESSALNSFKVTAEQLEKSITAKTKALILNSPNNPTGSVYTREELAAIGEVAVRHDLYIISDEIYEKLVYDKKHISIASLSDDLYQRTIVVNGLSKAYAMTGWRIGYSASNVKLAKLMSNIQSHETSNPNTIAQYAGVEALNSEKSAEAVESMRQEFSRRMEIMTSLLDEIDGIGYVRPSGAFYVMVDVSAYYTPKNGIDSSTSFAARLLEQEKVAVIPGIAFGANEYIRLSYATSEEVIRTGIARIGKFVKGLERNK